MSDKLLFNQQIKNEKITTMQVRQNVAKLEFTFFIPILIEIVVKLAKIADKKLKINHIQNKKI